MVLPALHYEVFPRVVTEKAQLSKLRYVNAITSEEPQYYLDSNGDWYQGVFTKILRRTPFLKRLVWWDDVIEVDMTFRKLDSPPMTDLSLMRYLMSAATLVGDEPFGDKKLAKAARKELKACTSLGEMIQWLIKHKIDMARWDRVI